MRAACGASAAARAGASPAAPSAAARRSGLPAHARGSSSGRLAAAASLPAPRAASRRPLPPAASLGKSVGDEVGGAWIDLTKLVTGGGGKRSPYDELAAEIGKQVYVDLAGWHLYTRDMTAASGLKMDQALAMQLGPKAAERLRESDITAVLKKIPVKAGAGKMTVSLHDVMPSMCVGDLTKIVEDYGRNM